MTTVGLYDEDTRIYYMDERFVVLDPPGMHNTPLLIKRTIGKPTHKEVLDILRKVKMHPIGEGSFRSDGLWCQFLKEKSNERFIS